MRSATRPWMSALSRNSFGHAGAKKKKNGCSPGRTLSSGAKPVRGIDQHPGRRTTEPRSRQRRRAHRRQLAPHRGNADLITAAPRQHIRRRQLGATTQRHSDHVGNAHSLAWANCHRQERIRGARQPPVVTAAAATWRKQKAAASAFQQGK